MGRDGATDARPISSQAAMSSSVGPARAVLRHDLYMFSERRTAKARHLAANPEVVVHLESAEDVVIANGTLEDMGLPRAHADVLAALEAKHSSRQDVRYLPSTERGLRRVVAVATAAGDAVASRLARRVTGTLGWPLSAAPDNDSYRSATGKRTIRPRSALSCRRAQAVNATPLLVLVSDQWKRTLRPVAGVSQRLSPGTASNAAVEIRAGRVGPRGSPRRAHRPPGGI